MSTEIKTIKNDSKEMEACSGCERPIADKYLLRIRTESWHEQCAVCSICGSQLQESCFVKDNRLFCRYDYAKHFGTRCSGCGQPIVTNELIMRALQHVYHLSCFVCIACNHPLQKGDQFVVRDGQVLCRFDYERELAMTLQRVNSGSPHSDEMDDLDDSDSEMGSRGGAKRPRTILSTGQRRKFKSAFEVNPKPSRKVREALAAETGLSVRVVQVWFQNQRAKVKKIARRQQSNPESTGAPQESEGSENPTTDAAPSNDDNVSCSGETQVSDLTNNNNLPGPKSDDPMDKLYSMQNAYFT